MALCLSYGVAAAAAAVPLAGVGRHHRSPPLPARSSSSRTAGLSSLRHLSVSLPSTPSTSSADVDLAALSDRQLTVLLKQQRDWKDALQVFEDMRRLPSYAPNAIHYNVVLRALARARRWGELRSLWLSMAADAVLPTNNTYAALIDAYAKAGCGRESLLWLRHMKLRGVAPDEVTMSTVVQVLKDGGEYDKGAAFFKNWCAGLFDIEFLGVSYDMLDVSTPTHFLLAELLKIGCRPPVSVIVNAGAGEGPRKPKRAATYNTMVDLYGKAGKLKEASDSFAEMLRIGVVPDTTTFNVMINLCSAHGHVEEAEALFNKMADRKAIPDTKTFNILMTMYKTVGDIYKVSKYYRKIKEVGLKPDIVSNRIVLQALCSQGVVGEVEKVIGMMLESGDSVDEQLVPVVMKMYIDLGLLEEAELFFEKHCRIQGMSSKNYAAVMDAYAEKGLWKAAEEVFYTEKPTGSKKDIAEYNVMIKAYGLAMQYDKANSLLQAMKRRGIQPDDCTYNSLIQMNSNGDFPERARELLGKMKDAGFRPICKTYSAIIASFSHKSLVSEAVDMFEEMRASGVNPNEVVYGLLVNMFAELGNVEEAVKYCTMMEEAGFTGNQVVLTSLIKAHGKLGQWKEAQNIYAEMKRNGVDTTASNCMINVYANLGMVTEAKAIFDELRRNAGADGVSYTTMMYLYKNAGMLDEVLDVARAYQNSGLLFDNTSYNAVLASYVSTGKIKDCAELLKQMKRGNVQPDASTLKMLITIFKKAGLPGEAVQQMATEIDNGNPYANQAVLAMLFCLSGMHSSAVEYCEELISPDVALSSSECNVAIKVLGTAGEIEKALNLFMRMNDAGLEADQVTYLYLAECYGKARMVEGLRRIHSLLKYREIDPCESLYNALRGAYEEAGRRDLAALVYQEMRGSVHSEAMDSSEAEVD